jgi:hypothetical protein
MIAVYLKTLQFQNFCVAVGYRDSSSSIRKCIAIGKVYPLPYPRRNAAIGFKAFILG